MAEQLDVSAITNNPPRGAGDRLGHLLEVTKPVWMGRRRPIAGDPPRISQSELDQVRQALVSALEIIDRHSR